MRDKYIKAINRELEQGNITRQNRIRRMGKGIPVEEWDEAQLKRLCTLSRINFLFSKEEEKAINAREAEIMRQRGIRHSVCRTPYLSKLEGEDIAAIASNVKDLNKGAHDGDYWDAIDSAE